MRAARCLALVAILVAGCKSTPDDGYALDLRLTFDSSVSDDALGRLTTIHLDVSGAESFSTDVATAGKLNGRSAGLRYKPGAQSGALSFGFTALDGNRALLAVGSLANVTLTPGKTKVLTVTLSGSSGTDAGADAAIDGGAGDSGPSCPDGTGCSGGTGVCLNGTCCTGCIANGTCVPGTSDASCGKGGATCFDCTKNGATCGGGQCSGCDATSCTSEGRTCGTSSCGFNCGGCGDSCLNGALTHSTCMGKSCQPSGTVSCSPYATCADATTCATTCAGDSLCSPGNYCDASSHCVPKLAKGSACTPGMGNQCLSGNCVDGVCCSAASCGACNSCDLTGSAGDCAPVAAGTDDARCAHDAASTCGHTGLCNAAGACDFYAAGTVCAPQACSSNGLSKLAASTCPGGGAACPTQASTSCGHYACYLSAGVARCYTSCGRCATSGCAIDPNFYFPNECAPGYTCKYMCALTMCSAVTCQ